MIGAFRVFDDARVHGIPRKWSIASCAARNGRNPFDKVAFLVVDLPPILAIANFETGVFLAHYSVYRLEIGFELPNRFTEGVHACFESGDLTLQFLHFFPEIGFALSF